MQSQEFLQSLIQQAEVNAKDVQDLRNYDFNLLCQKKTAKEWSILECVEHLNLYSDFYLPQVERKIAVPRTSSAPTFKAGLLGNYFSKMMLPREKINKMKTAMDMNPLNANLDKSVIDRFLLHQSKLIELLKTSENVSLSKIKIKTSISSLIKLQLGDCFQFLNNHTIRHIAQLKTVLQNL